VGREGALARTARVGRGLALVLSADLDAAEAHASRAYQEGLSNFDPELLVPHGYVLALVHLFRGDDHACHFFRPQESRFYREMAGRKHMGGGLAVYPGCSAVAGDPDSVDIG